MGGGCCRREALGISSLDSESIDRGSNPREALCTPASLDELRSVVLAVGVVLLGLGCSRLLVLGPICGLGLGSVCIAVRKAGSALG